MLRPRGRASPAARRPPLPRAFTFDGEFNITNRILDFPERKIKPKKAKLYESKTLPGFT